MSLLVNIITAHDDEIEAIAASRHPVEEWTGVEAREIDSIKLATLHCLLIDDALQDAVTLYQPVYALGDEGPMVVRIPASVTEKLALLEEDGLERVGEELAATEEFEMTNWPAEEAQFLVQQLADLARVAESQGKALFVWMHPLQT